MINDPSIKKDSHVDFNVKNLDTVRFVEVNSLPAVREHLIPKYYVDDGINEISLFRNNQGNDFKIFKLTNMKSIILNTQTVNDNQVTTKSKIDQLHQEKE